VETYKGREVLDGWSQLVDHSQRVKTLILNGQKLDRIEFGEESWGWGKEKNICYDCMVDKKQLHVIGCDGEQCPRCFNQLFICSCK